VSPFHGRSVTGKWWRGCFLPALTLWSYTDNCRSLCRILPMNDRRMTVVARHGLCMQKWYCESVKYLFYLVILVVEMLHNHVTNVWNLIVCFMLYAVYCNTLSCTVKVIRNLEWKKQNVASFCFVLWTSQVSMKLLA
jgi:hypothetical protein